MCDDACSRSLDSSGSEEAAQIPHVRPDLGPILGLLSNNPVTLVGSLSL